jgi:hypothetical protein
MNEAESKTNTTSRRVEGGLQAVHCPNAVDVEK